MRAAVSTASSVSRVNKPAPVALTLKLPPLANLRGPLLHFKRGPHPVQVSVTVQPAHLLPPTPSFLGWMSQAFITKLTLDAFVVSQCTPLGLPQSPAHIQ